MVKCKDCKELDYTGPNPEYTLEFWGFSCKVGKWPDDERISALSEFEEEITIPMLIADRKCSCFDQLKCVRCGTTLTHDLKHPYEGFSEDDACETCGDLIWREYLKEQNIAT